MFRYGDRPGMIGRIGTAFGEAGVNIVSAAVGRQDDGDGAAGEAVMVVTTDAPVPREVVDAIVGDRRLHAAVARSRSVATTHRKGAPDRWFGAPVRG